MCFVEHSFFRAKLGELLPDDEEQSRIKDTVAVKSARSALKNAPSASTESQPATLIEGDQQDLSQLATIRAAHQTRRAAKSTRTHNSQANNSELPIPSTASQRNQICSQMADVIRRSGTGLERNTRWTSGSAPGTKDPAEVSLLSGNSANAELAAKERVNAVCVSLPLPRSIAYHSRPCRLLDCGQDSSTTSPSTSPDTWLMGWWATTTSRTPLVSR